MMNRKSIKPHQIEPIKKIAQLLLSKLETEIGNCREDVTTNRPTHIFGCQRCELPDNYVQNFALSTFLDRPVPIRPKTRKLPADIILGAHGLDPWWELCVFGSALYITSAKLDPTGVPAFTLPTLTYSLLAIRHQWKAPKGAIAHNHTNLAADSNNLCCNFHSAGGDIMAAAWSLYISLRDKKF